MSNTEIFIYRGCVKSKVIHYDYHRRFDIFKTSLIVFIYVKFLVKGQEHTLFIRNLQSRYKISWAVFLFPLPNMCVRAMTFNVVVFED